MSTTWKVEGTRPKVKIIADCSACHTKQAFLDEGDPIDPLKGKNKVIQGEFKHNGCGGRVEKIPIDVQ
jgi:hypothetical protein